VRSLLSTLTDESKNPQSSLQRLSPAQQGELQVRLEECKSDLHEVKKILHQYRSLDTNDPRFRDRLAFTTGKQVALRERISTHSERIQQFLSGINIATFSRIERNTEAQLVSLSEILARLEHMHGDLLAGKRDPSILQGISAVTAVQKEILRDDVTASDVDLSDVVSQWLHQVRHEHKTPTKSQSTECLDEISSEEPVPFDRHSGPPLQVDKANNNASTSSSLDFLFADAPPSSPRPHTSVEKQTPADLDAMFEPMSLSRPRPGNSLDAMFARSPLQQQQQQDAVRTDGQSAKVHARLIDLLPLAPQTVLHPNRLCHYLPASKKCTPTKEHRSSVKYNIQALLVRVELSKEEWRHGTELPIKMRRNIYKKSDLLLSESVLREEMNSVTIRLGPQKKNNPIRILFKHMGNRTVRYSRLVRDAEVVVAVEDVVFQFECGSTA
jgi:hypothetical protein